MLYISKINVRKATKRLAKRYNTSIKKSGVDEISSDPIERLMSDVDNISNASSKGGLKTKGSGSPVIIIQGSKAGKNNIKNKDYSSEKDNSEDKDKKNKDADKENKGTLKFNKKTDASNIKCIGLESLKANEETNVNIDDVFEDSSNLDIKYPLTPSAPRRGEKVFAWAHIHWDEKLNYLVYDVIEPPVTEQDKKQIKLIKKTIEEEINVDFKSFSKGSSTKYIQKMMEEVMKRMNIGIAGDKLDIYKYYVIRDFVGLGILQPILNDPQIEDISCDGVNIPVYIYHRDSRLGSLRSNVVFRTHEELDTIVMRISQKCGRAISMAEPLLQGSLPDGSRVQATLATDIASKGSNITIRRFLKEPLTPTHMMNYGTMDSRILAYLWLAIESGKSILIVGATASGKTSDLNALSLFIDPASKIVSIEDTPELKLPHTHWIPEVARAGYGETTSSGQKRGEVSMFDLLKGSLRQRPDFIIVGEIRGTEASVFFQQVSTGHPGISTFHADSLEKVIDRLTTRPINLSKSLLETLDIVIFAKRLKVKKGYARKITHVYEIAGYDSNNDSLLTNNVFEWDAFKETFATRADSYIVGKIANEMGITKKEVQENIKDKMKVLEWMSKRYITNYQRVSEVIKAYYNEPATLMELIGEYDGD